MKRPLTPLRLGRGAPRRALSLALAGLAALLGQATARAAESCTAASTRVVAPVIELYTSEGCNSCPPADRWLSKLKADPTVVALAFHVDYWDRLGWKDRFASAAFTARQARQQASNGARFSYTPQVVVDGRDRTDWSRATVPGAARPPALVDIALRAIGRPVRRHRHAGPRLPRTARRLLGGHRAGPRQRREGGRERRRHPAPRLRRARLRGGAGLVGARRRCDHLALQGGDGSRRGASAQRQPRRRRRATGRPVQAVEDRLLTTRERRPGPARRAAPRAAARRSRAAPRTGRSGCAAAAMSSSRTCTLPSACGWL